MYFINTYSLIEKEKKSKQIKEKIEKHRKLLKTIVDLYWDLILQISIEKLLKNDSLEYQTLKTTIKCYEEKLTKGLN